MKLAVTLDFDCRPLSRRRRWGAWYADAYAARLEVWPFTLTFHYNFDRIFE